MQICGIDEAGRGPVIGPLVICGVAVDEKDEVRLKNIGAKDSKLLTPGQREVLAKQIHEIASYKCVVVQPEEIDRAVNAKKYNLNWLEADKSAEIIDYLKPAKAYVDCPSPNISAYAAYIRKRISRDVELVADHHAESKFITVAAASILAKVRRDSLIEKLKKKYGIEFGSGYPADPITVDFLKKNFNRYPIFRKSWSSFTNVVEQKKQKTLGEF